MAAARRHSQSPHGSGASLDELRGWRAFLNLARELKLARLARLARPYRRRAILSVIAMLVVTISSLTVPYLLKVAIDSGIVAGNVVMNGARVQSSWYCASATPTKPQATTTATNPIHRREMLLLFTKLPISDHGPLISSGPKLTQKAVRLWKPPGQQIVQLYRRPGAV